MNVRYLKFRNMTIALLFYLICISQAYAAEFFADSALSFKRLNFKAKSSDGLTNYKLSPLFTMLSVTGGMVIDKLYIAVNLENSLVDSKLDNAVYSDKLSRTDSNITFGFYIQNNLSVFAGYLTGDTKDSYSSSTSNNETGTISFSEEGLFVGANYIVSLSSAALSLNLAYAFLDGEYELDFTNNNNSGTKKHKGDTSGISIGAKYVSQWTKQVNYFVGAKVNLFEFNSRLFDTEEQFYIAQAGISYKFKH